MTSELSLNLKVKLKTKSTPVLLIWNVYNTDRCIGLQGYTQYYLNYMLHPIKGKISLNHELSDCEECWRVGDQALTALDVKGSSKSYSWVRSGSGSGQTR